MPIREYDCPKCGKFEVIDLSIKEIKQTIKCEKCGRVSNLLLSSCNAQFIGSGFYQNDYKKDKKVRDRAAEKVDKKTGE